MINDIKNNFLLLESMRNAGNVLWEKYGRNVFIYDILNYINKISNKTNDLQLIKTKPIKNLIILDPGLKDKGSHHHQINYNIYKKLSKKTNIFVLANEKINIKLPYEVKNIFRNSIYDFDYSKPSIVNQQAIIFSREIINEFQNYNVPFCLYIHTCTLPLLLGISFVIDKIIDKIDILYIELMFLPNGYEQFHNNNNNLYDYLYLQALNKITNTFLKNFKYVRISTSNKFFKIYYENLLNKIINNNITIDIHPHVMLTDKAFTIHKSENSHYKFDGINILVHAGDPRPGKGLQWIKDNISELINLTNHDVYFHLHLNKIRFPDDYPVEVEIVSWLMNFSISNCRMIIHSDKIAEDDWFNFLSNFDYFIIPNEPNYYKHKTSGLVFDVIYTLGSAERVFVFENTLSYKILRDQSIYISKIDDFIKYAKKLNRKNVLYDKSLISKNDIFSKPHAEYVALKLGFV